MNEGLQPQGLPSRDALRAAKIAAAKAAEEAGNAERAEQYRWQCERLLGFTEYRFPRYRTSKVHRFLCEQLERVERREVDRMMIRMPPRHGKTEIAAKSFPAHVLGRDPHHQFLCASASVDLALDTGKKVRNIIGSEAYKLIYPNTKLEPDSRAAGKWNTTEGGTWYSIGVGGAVMGRGAHTWVIDDPFGTMADAQSETIRAKVWDWFNGTVYNRLEPDGAIVIIGHRMHEDDLQGARAAPPASTRSAP